MNYQNEVVRNGNITFQRIIAVMLCFTLVLIPISICWLYIIRTPKDIIRGNITSKWSGNRTVLTGKGSTIMHIFYVRIEETQFEVSGAMYRKLSIGDYISAGYRKHTIYYYIVGGR